MSRPTLFALRRADPRQQLFERRYRARRVAGALLRLGEEKPRLGIVGMKARVLAQLPDLRVHAAASLTHQKARAAAHAPRA